MFLFKKIVSQFLFPLPVCLFLGLAGLAFLWWSKRQKTGRALVTAGLLGLFLLSYEPIATLLLLPLERRAATAAASAGQPVKYVVVLGGGHTADRELPLTSQLTDESLKRLIEGICVFRQNPESQLVLSGGGWSEASTESETMQQLALKLGVEETSIVVESRSKDTASQAELVRAIVSTNRFYLVTSASHMPRSLLMFWSQGLRAEPAPADHLVKRGGIHPARFFPRAHYLRQTERAIYEYLGLAWFRIGHAS